MQYIINGLTYNLVVKQSEVLRLQNESIDSKLNKTIERAEKLNINANKITEEVKDIKKDIRSIITTIISVILAISIIPTAIVGIDKISADYILPFLSSIILFGVIMIAFVYSIYQEKLKKSTWIILLLIIIICIYFWKVSFITTISKDIDNQKLINETNIQTGEFTTK